MTELSTYLRPRDLQRISNLEVLARLVVEGFWSGMHRSPHKGFSVEFRQHRQYVPGDEIRRLDWKVFGKTDRFYIREYEDETNLRATILLDASGSMAYRNAAGFTRFHYASRIAAALAYLLFQQQDSVGLITFDTQVRSFIPARARPGHLRVILDQLQKTVPGGETDLPGVFHDLVPKINRRGLLIIISDCFASAPELLRALSRFRYAKHDVIVFQIWDREELEFDFRGWTRFESLEKTGDHQRLDPALVRDTYLANLAKFRAELEEGCRRDRIDLTPLVTDQPYAEALAQYLSLRKRRG